MFAWLRCKVPPLSKEKRRVIEALIDSRPTHRPCGTLKLNRRGDANEEYRTYFLDNRNRRIDALAGFLKKFDVALSLNDEGVSSVSAWLQIYVDLLVDGLSDQENDEIWCAYHWFQAPWTGPLAGLNPIFDLGVYMGECVLRRNPRLKWWTMVDPEPGKGVRHLIFVQRGQRFFDPMRWMYEECQNMHWPPRSTKTNPDTTRFFKTIQARAIE